MRSLFWRWGGALVSPLFLAFGGIGCGDDGGSPGVSSSASRGETGDDTTSTGALDESTGSSTGSTTLDSAEGSGDTAGPMVSVDCGDPPPGAIGAEYSHQPTASGFPGGVSWSMTGLPMGMSFSPVNGEMNGAPQEAGTFDVEVTASGSNLMAMQTCTIEIGDALSVDLSALAQPCIGPTDDVLDYVSGGDGAPIVCATPGGSGNAVPPNGVSVDPDTCAIVGDPDDTFGIWVWITTLEQSGYKVHVPYCVAEADQAPGEYAISADHTGGTDNVLQPAVGSFAPGQPIAWGGSGDPLVTVIGPCGQNSCYYGFVYHVAASPFGGCAMTPCYGLSPSGLEYDANNDPIGFHHEMFAKGPAVPSGFETRPFVLNWDLDYCITDDSQACSGVTNIEANGNGHLRFGVIMLPQ